MKVLIASLALLSFSAFADCTDFETARNACAKKARPMNLSAPRMSVEVDLESFQLNVHTLKMGNRPLQVQCFYTYNQTIEFDGKKTDATMVGFALLNPKTCEFLPGSSAATVSKYEYND